MGTLARRYWLGLFDLLLFSVKKSRSGKADQGGLKKPVDAVSSSNRGDTNRCVLSVAARGLRGGRKVIAENVAQLQKSARRLPSALLLVQNLKYQKFL
jgi:hypothetical protein